MSNNEHEDELEDELDSDSEFYKKFKDGVPTLLYNHGNELTPKTVGESTFTWIECTDDTDIFKERDSDKGFITIEAWEPAEFNIIEEPDSTEIISEEKSLETLLEINQFLAEKYVELTNELKELTKNYQKLTKDTKNEIARLNKRIEELIESKVSVSRTPSYWLDEVFSEEIERENVEE